MGTAGVRPIADRELTHPRRAAVAVLPQNASQALRRLRRGPLVTSSIWPLAVRLSLLRLGGVHLGSAVGGLERCWFESEHVRIGAGTWVNACCWFEGHGAITVGRDCMFGPEVMLVTSVHAISADGEVAREPSYQGVRIGDRCWLGARVMIMPGATVGEGTVIAAGSVVTKDCEPGAVYAGVPARRIR